MIFNEDNDELDKGNDESSNCLNIQQVDGFTAINVPFAACKTSTPSLAFELTKFHLAKSKLLLFDVTGSTSDSSLDVVTLTNAKDLKYLLELIQFNLRLSLMLLKLAYKRLVYSQEPMKAKR